MSEKREYVKMPEISNHEVCFFRQAHERHCPEGTTTYQPNRSPKINKFFKDNRSKIHQHPLPARDTELPAWLHYIGLSGNIEVEEGVFLRVTFPAETIARTAVPLYTTPEKFREFLRTSL